MSTTDNISNTFVRDGVSQLQRTAPALSPGYVKMDERSTAELLSLLYRYAKYVLYYDDSDYLPVQKADLTLTPKGDWQDFFRNNAPFQYAAIQQFPSAGLETAYQQARALLNRQQLPAGQYWPLFNRVLAVVLQLNRWYTQLADSNTGLQRMLDALVRADFSKALHRLLAVANTFTEADESPYDLAELVAEEAWELSMDKRVAVNAYLLKLAPWPRRQQEKILQQLDELFSIFYKGVQQVQAFALTDFQQTLGSRQDHPVQTGLLYAFLELFSQVKAGMNNITRKHLDFFYKEILQLRLKPHVPDHVHVVTTLAKQVNVHLLEKDTALKAGKDSAGKDVTFRLEEEAVQNKALVSQLRTLFKDKRANLYIAPVANSADGVGAAFQNPANNSWPVLGAAAYTNKNNPAAGPQHFPFAGTGFMLASPVLLLKEGTREVVVQIALQGLDSYAAALAALLANSSNLAAGSLLEVAYSSKTGWAPAPAPAITFDAAAQTLQITFTLPPAAPPITAPDPEQLKADYGVQDPLLRILFNHRLRYSLLTGDDTPWYDVLGKAVIKNITVNVIAHNVKDLLLGNDDGPVDANKAFFPFTTIPKTGSSFYIGSNEAFRKKLTGMKLLLEWDGLPTTFTEHYKGYKLNPPLNNNSFSVKAEKLEDGYWTALPTLPPVLPLFSQDGAGILLPLNTLELDPVETAAATAPARMPLPQVTQTAPLTPYNNAALNGFVRLQLNQHFYHQEYPLILAQQTLRIGELKVATFNEIKNLVDNGDPDINKKGVWQLTSLTATAADDANDQAVFVRDNTHEQVALDVLAGLTENTKTNADEAFERAGTLNTTLGAPDTGIPKPPYTPAIKSFSLDYSATAAATDLTLLHLYPYEASNYQLMDAGATVTLMPVYNEEGNLYIGLTDATPGSNIALLFQLAEFSANPDIPAANVFWQYLAGNEWKELRKDAAVLSDTTQGLLTSGIVTIALPWDADVQHTILPSGYHWLKAANAQYTAAVCEAVAVAAQGARAVFNNQENDLQRLGAPLPPQSIGGLVTPQSAVKEITQDFPSFGGRKAETDPQFYIRVSERLRHKGRAINVYDFERLVLEAFPAIHKVKCIPHTKMCRDSSGNGTPLPSPGWVTLAVIPEIGGIPPDARFEPKVSRILLQEVSAWLQLRTSGFVRVQIINPAYQPVNFSGNILFRKGKDERYYLDLLEKEVQEYLSPWILTGSQDIVFGGTLMMSAVLQFVEQRTYVEYVTDFKMYQEGELPVKAITAATPWSVLVAGQQQYIPLQC